MLNNRDKNEIKRMKKITTEVIYCEDKNMNRYKRV